MKKFVLLMALTIMGQISFGQMSSITIKGPVNLKPGATATYECYMNYTDGRKATKVTGAIWSVEDYSPSSVSAMKYIVMDKGKITVSGNIGVDFSFYVRCKHSDYSSRIKVSVTGRKLKKLEKEPEYTNKLDMAREKLKVVTPTMVRVEGAEFMMGSIYEDEQPYHRVRVRTFYIGQHEVTQKEYKEIMGSNPSYFKGDNLPVEKVSWDDAVEYCRRLSEKTGKKYRLPTEAEWEYAAKGGRKSKRYKYSGSDNIDEVAWYHINSDSKIHPSGQKKGNELDLYDMSGNVWEWCSDWYGDYKNYPWDNPKGPSSGEKRVLRGGSWDFIDDYCRVTKRNKIDPNTRVSSVGFRVVHDDQPWVKY